MPKYSNSIEQQLKLIQLQREHSHSPYKLTRRLNTNRIMAKSTQNVISAIRNPFIRFKNQYLTKNKLKIDRKYLLKDYNKNTTFDLHNHLSDNERDAPGDIHYLLLSLSIGFIIGYHLCMIDNDHNNMSVYYWTRYPDIMKKYQDMKDYKYSDKHQNSIYENICYFSNLRKFELNTQVGYQRFKREVKEGLFHNPEEEQRKEKQEEQNQQMIEQSEKGVQEFNKFLEEQSSKLESKKQ